MLAVACHVRQERERERELLESLSWACCNMSAGLWFAKVSVSLLSASSGLRVGALLSRRLSVPVSSASPVLGLLELSSQPVALKYS